MRNGTRGPFCVSDVWMYCLGRISGASITKYNCLAFCCVQLKFKSSRRKDDWKVCTVGTRKKMEHKQLPGRVCFPSTRSSSISSPFQVRRDVGKYTVVKLYAMVRNYEQWDLEDPRAQRLRPVHYPRHGFQARVHIRRNNSEDLPADTLFPRMR